MKIVAAKMPVAAKRRNAIRKNANVAMRVAAWQSAATAAVVAATKIIDISLGITIAIITSMVAAIEKPICNKNYSNAHLPVANRYSRFFISYCE